MHDLKLKKISVKDFLSQVANNGNRIINSELQFINIENDGESKNLVLIQL